jgi:ribosomal protein S18 acetylase RimI-like enzyme
MINQSDTIMQQYTLRKATESDTDFFYHVKKTVLKKYIEEIWGWDEEFQIQFHRENYHTTYCSIIYCSNVAAGTVEIKEDEEVIFISSLYLLPGYQGRGIGSAIISRCLETAQQNKKRVALEVLKVNVDAQRLYSRLGFTLAANDDTKFYMYKDCMNEQNN